MTYSITYDSRSVTFTVSGRGSASCRYLCRRDDQESAWQGDDVTVYSSSYTFSNLEPETTYAVNVQYSITYVTEAGDITVTEWLGKQTFTTPAESNAWIFTAGGWTRATPYVYVNGTWKKAASKIYSGGWKPS